MLNVGTVLLIDSDTDSRKAVVGCAVQRGETPILCSSCEEARSLLARHHFRVVFCNEKLPDGKYAEIIKAARPTPVVVLSRTGEWTSYLDALEAGAFDYIASADYPLEVARIFSLALDGYSRTARKRGAAA